MAVSLDHNYLFGNTANKITVEEFLDSETDYLQYIDSDPESPLLSPLEVLEYSLQFDCQSFVGPDVFSFGVEYDRKCAQNISAAAEAMMWSGRLTPSTEFDDTLLDAEGCCTDTFSTSLDAMHVFPSLSQREMTPNAKDTIAVASFPFQAISSSQGSSLRSSPETTEKRSLLNVLERARREDLKASFQALRNIVPELVSDSRAVKGVILSKAADYIHKLNKESADIENTLAELRAENLRLRQAHGVLTDL
jgi:hypothetical protein